MKRILQLLLLTLLATSAWANFCNNPVPPCATDDPASPCYKPPDPPAKCEPEVCGKCTKSPCYVGSGVYVRNEQDLMITAVSEPIEVSRRYQSTRVIDGQTGYGWTSSLSTRLHYTAYLKASPSSYQKEANVRMPDGAVYRFVENPDGSFAPPEGRFDTLVQNGDGTFDLWIQRTRTRLHFAAGGSLLSVVDDFGNTQTWTYLNDRLQRVADSAGSNRYIDVTYGADGRISDVIDSSGRAVHYVYDTLGVLTSTTDPAGRTTTYGYTAGKYVPLLTSVVDPWGRTISTIVRDAQDRVLSYTDRGETFTYSYSGGQTSKADSSGNTWVYPFGSGGLVSDSIPPGGGAAEHTDYYPSGLVQLHTDAVGVKTHYTYDARGNPLTITHDHQGPTAVEWRLVYDTTYPDNLLSAKPYLPATGQIHPDWQGRRYEYYGPGSAAPGALQHSYRLGSDGTTSYLDVTFTYDAQGRILTAKNATGHETTLTYDLYGNLEKVERPPNNDNGIRPTEVYVYDSLGRVTAATDAAGHTSTFTWDVLDRVTSATLPKPFPSSTLTFTTGYFYDEYDSATQLLYTRVVDPNGRSTRTGFDQFGQALRLVDQAGNVVRNVYTNGLFTAQIDANDYTTSYAYDARRRLSTVTFADGTYEQLTYRADDLVASKRDRKNQVVTFAYDRHKRVTAKTYPNGGAITQTFQGEKLTQVSDTFASPAETHTYVYDSAFRLTSNTQASRGTVSFTYGVADRLATMTVAGGAVSTYDYYPDGGLRTIAWSPVSGTFRYDYTLNGQPQAITYPNGQTRTYAYDQQGRPTSVTNAHPVAGLLASFSYGYDVDPFTSQANLLGVRTAITANVPALGLTNAVTNLGYDSRYQLTRVDYPSAAPYSGVSSTWSYDAAGLRTSATTSGVAANYVYNKFAGKPLNGVQLQSDGANTYAYDGEGNITARNGSSGSFTFSWDYENRLRSVNGDTTAGYLYDYDGRRTMKTVGGASTTYLFSADHPIAESGATAAEYLYGVGLDQPLAMLRGGQIYYYGVDGVDSVVTLNDAAGAVQNTYAWDVWGSLLASTAAVVNPFGYTARDMGEAGMHYYRARYYEPASGRFASEDPLQELLPLPGRELYGYVKNSPAMYSDPSGLRCYSFSARGKPRLMQTIPGDKWWTVVEIKEAAPPPRIPFFRRGRIQIPWHHIGVRYTCFWRQWQRFTYHFERDVTTTTFCDCPPMVWTQESVERWSESEVRKIRAVKISVVNAYCNFHPPKD